MEIEVFKTGKHTDRKGNSRNWTVADIDKAVASYDPAYHEAPVVLGHPEDNAPAYGWVSGLKRAGDKLMASLKQLDPAFVEAVKAGRFKKRSVAFYADGSLRHVGFLGAMPPAVKGLADAAFSEPASCEVEFSEPGFGVIGSLWQRMRDLLIEKFGQETADRVVSNYDVETLKQIGSAPECDDAPAPAFAEPKGKEDMKTLEETKAALEAEKQKAAEFAESARKTEEKNKALSAQLQEKESAARRQEYSAFCDGLVKEGRLTPAQRPLALGVMELLSPVAEYEFAEGQKAAPLVEFKTFLSGLPQAVKFEEAAPKGKAAGSGSGQDSEFAEADPDRLALHKEISAMADKENISYAAACAKISGGK